MISELYREGSREASEHRNTAKLIGEIPQYRNKMVKYRNSSKFKIRYHTETTLYVKFRAQYI